MIDALRRRFATYEWQVAAGFSGAVMYRLVGRRETLFLKVVAVGAGAETAVDVDLVGEPSVRSGFEVRVLQCPRSRRSKATRTANQVISCVLNARRA